MTALLIVYHSQSGASAALARAACAGASADTGVEVSLRRACDAGVGDLAAASGLLLVAAENSGSLSGGAKEFLDRVFYPAIAQQLVLPYALLISAGNDGRAAVQQAERIFKGIPFTVANPPQIFRGEPGEKELAAAFDTGQALATGLSMGIF